MYFSLFHSVEVEVEEYNLHVICFTEKKIRTKEERNGT